MSAPTNPSSPASPAAPKKKSKRKLFILLGVAGLVLVALVVFAATRKKETGIPVTTEKAVVKTITHLVTATGKVQPEVEVKISPEVAGELIEIPVIEGQTVKKGDLLVRIKPDFYQAQLEQQEAALASAKAASVLSQARLNKAEQDFKQAQELYGKQLVSDADFTAAKTNIDVAKADFDSSLAQIRRTEGSLSQARDSLAKTTIYSPMDGSISSLTSEVGERVVGTGSFAGTEIMRIADLASMEVRVKVNENDIINVKVGDPAAVLVDAFPGRKFTGVVGEISSSAITSGAQSAAASASDEVTNFLVKIRVKDRDVKLRPGMSATVDIETETVTNVVAVPIQSVTVRAAGGKTAEELQAAKAKEAKERSGNDLELVNEKEDARRNRDNLQRVVFIKSGDTVKQQLVETGLADNTSIEIKSGIKAGDEVVSGSYAAISRRLKDGSKVMIEKPKKEEAAK
ncbi:MAG TPA: efflux RND transporter periplasmic adaptor subunit [Lacunisphaera sp.]